MESNKTWASLDVWERWPIATKNHMHIPTLVHFNMWNYKIDHYIIFYFVEVIMYNEASNQYYTACLPHLTDIASLMYQLSSLLWYGALQLLTFSAKK